MPQQIKRLIIVFAIFIVLFLIIRQVLVPRTFGEFGHYRGAAIQENALKPLRYAGSALCTNCHESEHSDKSLGLHAHLKCEVCHGPGLKHALYAAKFKNGELPDSLKLYKPVERKDCALCHEENAARIKILFDTIDNTMIHQVNTLKHNTVNRKTNEKLKCIDCHNPHQP
jgi:hypothetical protein